MSNKIKVCMAMLATNGGSSVVAQAIGERLSRVQDPHFEVGYCHLRPEQAKPGHFVLDGEQIKTNCMLLDVEPGLAGAMATVNQLLQVYQRWPFDVLHIHNFQAFGLSALLLKQIEGVPFVVTFHGSDILNPALFDQNAKIARHVLKHADTVTSVSQYLAAALRHKVPELEQVKVIGNFLHGAWSDGANITKPQQKRFLHVSSMRAVKRPELLLQAFAKLQQRHCDARLAIVTTTEGYHRTRKLMEQNKYSITGVELIDGDVDKTALKAEYAKAQGFVLTSHFEGFGLVVLEALAHGLPVIAPDVGALSEVLGSDWPYLVADLPPQQMTEAVANAMLALVEKVDSAVDAKTQQILTRFDGSEQVAGYAELYLKLVKH